ncbi:MAG: T9SS type A sorting domain-containing protein [bacterium]|nr:T9SS type A sorting domain-containing protein [bacterium]
MRILLLTVLTLVLLISSQASAQMILLTNGFQPEPGTQLVTKADNAMDNDYFNTLLDGAGGPMTWDFSDRTYATETVSEIVNPVSTPQIGMFPDANLVMRATFANDTSWTVFSSESSHFWQLGEVSHSAGSGEEVIIYQDSTPNYVFPIAFGDQWSSHRYFEQGDDPDLYMEIYDTTFYNVDAWGTVVYGNKSLPALRIVSEQRITYVQVENGTPTPMYTSENTTVSFVTAGFKTAVSAYKASSLFIVQFGGGASSEFLDQLTDVDPSDGYPLPKWYAIEQNYPNPFNPQTEIRFSVPSRSDVRLTVYNVAGQLVRELMNEEVPAGTFVASWNGTNEQNQPVGSGVYFYRLEAGAFSSTKKMVLLK